MTISKESLIAAAEAAQASAIANFHKALEATYEANRTYGKDSPQANEAWAEYLTAVNAKKAAKRHLTIAKKS